MPTAVRRRRLRGQGGDKHGRVRDAKHDWPRSRRSGELAQLVESVYLYRELLPHHTLDTNHLDKLAQPRAPVPCVPTPLVSPPTEFLIECQPGLAAGHADS